MAVVDILHEGIRQLGIDLPSGAEERLNAYLALLAKWNRVYNLTAIRDEHRMMTHHLLDSLVLMPHLEKVATLADVGSGAGVPGIPLAIVRPQMHVTLIESSQKKASFLQQARIELKLENVSIHSVRVEDFMPPRLFDAAISRAFADLAKFVALAGHLLAPNGRLLAMKGAEPESEIGQLPAGWAITEIIPLVVPELPAQRHLIVLQKT